MSSPFNTLQQYPEQTSNYLKYGSIVSLMLDYNPADSLPTLEFNPNKHNAKAKNIEQSLDKSMDKGAFKKIKTHKPTNKAFDNLLQKQFLFTQGVFSDSCFFYQFDCKTDIDMNYINTLFLIIPASENESLRKIKKIIKKIEKEMTINSSENKSLYKQSIDIFIKFKQEILTNHEQACNILKNKTFVNFGDCVQFLHISSGKLLKFKKNSDDLKIYIQLSPKMSSNTIFRICHGYTYQSENTTHISFNLGIRIACGDKPINREKYLANGLITIEGMPVKVTKNIQNEQQKNKTPINKTTSLTQLNIRSHSLNLIDNKTNRLSQYTQTNNFHGVNKDDDFGKKITLDANQIISDDKSFNQWKLVKYSSDFIEDNHYVNSLDFFWIENCEKDAYLTSNEVSEAQLNYYNKRTTQSLLNQQNILNNNNILNSQFGDTNQHLRDKENEAMFLQKLPDKEEAFPIIQPTTPHNPLIHTKLSQRMKSQVDLKGYGFDNTRTNEENIYAQTNSNLNVNKNLDDDLVIPLSYFYDDHKNTLQFYQIELQPTVSDFRDPLGIFKFEILNQNFEEFSSFNIGPITSKTVFRIRNMFSNKLLCADKKEKKDKSSDDSDNTMHLKLVNYSDLAHANICKPDDTLFVIETAYEQKKKENFNMEDKEEDIDMNQENTLNKLMDDLPGKLIKKTDTIRIKSKKYNRYLAVRQMKKDNQVKLLLTKNLSDLTIFKMNFLHEADKYELQFLEQLRYALSYLQSYFKKETSKTANKANYSNIQHILIIFRNILSEYRSKVDTHEDSHTFDLLRNLNQFGIVQKLMDLFLLMWFKNYKSQNSDQLDLEDTIHSESASYKKIVSQQILKILKAIYDLDNSFITCIQDKLHYFFKFVGYIDKVTKFLIHILRNNHLLLLKLLSVEELGKGSKLYEEMKQSFKRIIQHYNTLERVVLVNDFESFALFFDLMNTMLICNDEPFTHFYDVFFKDFGLLIPSESGNTKIPNIDDNPFLVLFFIKNGKIWIRKKRFLTDKNNMDLINNSSKFASQNRSESNDENENNNNNEENDKESNSLKENENNVYSEYLEVDLALENFNHSLDNNDDASIISKIISLNILFYSNIALHDNEFKEYLGEIFKTKAIIDFIHPPDYSDNISNNSNNNNNKVLDKKGQVIDIEIKCGLIRIMNFLYLKVPQPLIDNMNLCRNIHILTDKEKERLKRIQARKNVRLGIVPQPKQPKIKSTIDKEGEIPKIITNVEKILSQHASNPNLVISETSLLLHLFESSQYIMRHIYEWKDKAEKKKKAFAYVTLILLILEGYIGGLKSPKARTSELDEEETKDVLINVISGDKLILNSRMHIVSNEYMKIYELFRKKFYYYLTSSERKKKQKSSVISSTTNSISRSPTKTSFPKDRTNVFTMKTPTRKGTFCNRTTNLFLIDLPNKAESNSYGGFALDGKSSRKEIVIKISKIFLEFLKYLENEYIDRVELNLIKLKELYENGKKALEIRSVVPVNSEIPNNQDGSLADPPNDKEEEKRCNTILMNDILKMNYIDEIKTLDDYLMINNKITSINENSNNNVNNNNSNSLRSPILGVGNCLDLLYEFARIYNEKRGKILGEYKNDIYGYQVHQVPIIKGENCITEIFLKCVQKLDVMELKHICFEIMFRLNSQNFIFFDNLSNLVVFATQSDLDKFELIKKHFIELFIILKNLFRTYILDASIIKQIEKFGIELNRMMKKIFNKKKWVLKCEELKIYTGMEDNQSDDNDNANSDIDNYSNSRDNENLSSNNSGNANDEVSNRNIVNENSQLLEDEHNNSNNNNKLEMFLNEDESPYFLDNDSEERIQLVQQVLSNLGFAELLTKFMEKSNQIIIKFSESDEKAPNYEHYNESVKKIQECLEDIYRLLGLFINNNKKHQLMIEEQIELILFPISLKNAITTNVMVSLSSFLLEFLRNFSVNELNNVENFIKMLTMLIQFDWKTKKKLIPYWVEILKIIIKTSSNENYEKLIECLNSIKNVLIEDIITNQSTENDIVSMEEILKLIIEMKHINLEDYENKAIMLLSLNDITNKFFEMLKDIERFAILLNLIIKYLNENLSLYKDEFERNKLLKRKLIKVVCNFCEKEKIKEEMIYSRENNNDMVLYHLNYFYGISLLKLYSIFSILTLNENSNSLFELCTSIVKLAENFYQVVNEVKINKKVTTFIDLEKLSPELEEIKNTFKGKFQDLLNLIESKKSAVHLDDKLNGINNFNTKQDISGINNINTTTALLNNSLHVGGNANHEIANKQTIKQKNENFVTYWNKMRCYINSNSKLREFHYNVRKLINFERENFIQNMAKYIANKMEDSNNSSTNVNSNTYTNNLNSLFNPSMGNDIKNNHNISSHSSPTNPSHHIYKILHNIFRDFISRNQKLKQQLYFYYWNCIHLMRYDCDNDTFAEDFKSSSDFCFNNTPYNKDVFNDKRLITFAMKCISKKNLKCIDYEMLVYFKFFNAYLNKLSDWDKLSLYEYLITSNESEKFYAVMKNILDNFKTKLVKLAGNSPEKIKSFKLSTLKRQLKNEEPSMNKFENEINPYEQVIQLINNLSESIKTNSTNQFITPLQNNPNEVENTHSVLMKNYLRFQYNSSKSINFISLLANILDFFTKYQNGDAYGNNNVNVNSSSIGHNGTRYSHLEFQRSLTSRNVDFSKRKSGGVEDNRIFIPMFYNDIINIIESLTKCCQGPCANNQNTLINGTRILVFMKQILIGLTYRKRPHDKDENRILAYDVDNNNNKYTNNYNENEDQVINPYNLSYHEHCINIGLTRKRLAFLKYKLLILLSTLISGRKKGDKIYEIIRNEIDLNVLRCILEETFREILTENKCEDHIDDLVFGDEMYLRYENFNCELKPDHKTENTKFIIFEVGTFSYILINAFYDNLTRPINYTCHNQITRFRKHLASEKKVIVKESVLLPWINFIKVFFRFILQFFICFKYCNCGHERDEEEDFELENNFEEAYAFYYKHTPNLGELYNEEKLGYYAKLYPKRKYLTSKMKEELVENLERTNIRPKIDCLFKIMEQYEDSLEYSQSISDVYKKFAFVDLILNQYQFYRDLAFFVSIGVNFVIVSSYHRIEEGTMETSDDIGKYDYGFLYRKEYIDETKLTLKILSIIQLTLSCLIFANYFVKKIPKFFFYHKDNTLSIARKISLAISRLVTDFHLLYHIGYLIFAIIGFYTKNYLYLSVHLLEIIFRSRTLNILVQSLWTSKKQIGATLFLFYFIEYFFVIIIYMWIPDNLPTKDCFRFDDCFFTISDQTFKNSNGIINYLKEENLISNDILFVSLRFWLDCLFSIIQFFLIMNMVGGIMIDSFSYAREMQDEAERDKQKQNNYESLF